MSSRSSNRSRLMLSCHALVWLFLCSNGFARSATTTSLRMGLSIDENAFPGRGLQKEEEIVEENGTEAVTESPITNSTQPPTTEETEAPVKQFVEFQLLPFTIEIHGSLSADDLLGIRDDLQGYLLHALFEQDVEEEVQVKTDSIEIIMTDIVESVIPLAEEEEGEVKGEEVKGEEVKGEEVKSEEVKADEKDDKENRSRSLSLVLTSASIPAVSTRMTYEARAVLSFQQEAEVKKGVIEDTLIVVQEREIEVLENTMDLQAYFLGVLTKEEIFDSELHSILQDPVVLMEVQVDEREAQSAEWEEALETIQSTLETLKHFDTPVEIENENGVDGDIEDKNEANSNTSDQSMSFSENTKNIFSWKVIVGMVCTVMVLIGLVVIMCVLRKKKKLHSQKPADGVIEVNDVKKKDDPNNIVKNKQQQKKSFFQKKKKEELDEQNVYDDKSEMDSFGEKLNLYNVTSDDDGDSMMGYSLTSANRSRYHNEVGQDTSFLGNDDEEDEQEDSFVEDLSIISSISEACSSLVLAGVQKILKENKKANNVDQPTAKPDLGENVLQVWHNQEDQAPSLLGDDEAIDSTQEESLSRSDTFDTEDVEGASTYNKDDGSRYGDIKSVASVVSSNGIAATAARYYGEDEIMMSPKRTTSAAAPTEDFLSASRLSPIRNFETNSARAMIQNTSVAVVDDASDAPSDERNSGPAAAAPTRRGTADPYRYPDAIRNSRLLDNDPAVLDYLVKGDTRNVNHGMTGSIRRQPRMTMEL
eukprot:CAMPEP_0116095214 /NCGR_PEP_ID=MMETSP0327-20121206/9545_1 /TAXON_ID=44447 /ORGANISM="Pseudo-nitzschia delicatissima, Strain B596" /LENGTH=758 /DNA_ID=CAMNT_0003586869 /DNA_START=21 /DNA_END=2297 /DNA_ORIENTATION=-